MATPLARARPDGDPSAPVHETPLARLAHELNSRLDGSIRTLDLAQRALEAFDASRPPDLGDVASRLQTARRGMQEMAAMLDDALVGGGSARPAPARPLGDEIAAAVEGLAALAGQHDVAVRWTVVGAAADLPSGPLGTVLHNGIRNAIEACAMSGSDGGTVEIRAELRRDGTLVVHVTDDGCGLSEGFAVGRSDKPAGHGIGLRLVAEVVEGLGGSWRLVAVPYGPGAVLEVTVPAEALAGS
ncbi:MAG: sensor histidine kinase [Planctomycetota bacterium]|jgi:signal transduction histidine kinase